MASLTVNLLKSLKPTGKAYRKMDAGNAGFGVKVSPKGEISFIFRYKAADGRDVPMILGYYPDTSLSAARDIWRQWRAVYDSGRDPKVVQAEQLAHEEAQRKAAELARKQAAMQGSLGQLCAAYVDDLKTSGKRSWREVERAFEKDVLTVIPTVTKARDVTPERVREALAIIIQRDAMIMANRVRAYLSAAFKFGIEWDNDPKRHFETLRFGISANPVRDVPKPSKHIQVGERALSAVEVQQLWQALDDCKLHPSTVAVIRLLLALGGQRVEEILRLHADDVDMQNQLVTFRRTKNGRDHIIPFGGIAMPLLADRLQVASKGLLFSKVKGNADEVMEYHRVSRAIHRLCERSAMPMFTPRDIRRTVKTLMGFCGIRKEDRDRFQNHAMNDVSSKHYDRYDYLAEKRQVMAVWDTYLKSILTGEPKTNVIQLRVAG